MRQIFESFLNLRKKTPDDVKVMGAATRSKIIARGQAMKRLAINEDFIEFCKSLEEDKQSLIELLLNEELNTMKSSEQKIRLIARINQIDKTIGKARSLIWQMENLTEVRAAMQEKTHAVQDRGKNTGGEL